MSAGLSIVDWCVVAAYLAIVVLIGLRVSRRESSAKAFLLAGSSLPWWAATLSIIAAETSAVTLLGTPRMAYEGDWAFLQLVLGLVLGRIALGMWLVPVLYRHDILTFCGLLEKRFGNPTRVTAAVFFILGRVIASGVRLYAGCLAVQVATGFPLTVSVLLLGSLSLVYTIVGGLRAVVWTDVLLGLTFIAAGVVSAAFIAWGLPDGISTLLSDPLLAEKTAIFHLGEGFGSAKGLVAGLIGGFFLTLATHGTDQDVVQRILTCRDSQGGRRSILGTAVILFPLMTLFLLVGTLLFFFYRTKSFAYPLPANMDHLFPIFIVRELPPGIAGFVMAGLLAAAISSFASVLNALAATTLSDCYAPLLRARGKEISERHSFLFSRGAVFGWAVVMLLVALAFSGSEDNVLNIALSVLTYFYGGLLGAFLLGTFTTRGSSASVISGMILGMLAVLLLQARQFLGDPALAPESVRIVLEWLPEAAGRTVLATVPTIAWPWWIIVGTGITFGVGLLGRGARSADGPS